MRITVFTPTFNRGYIIDQLYKSLQRQTFSDFEWLVVDDGSSDNTESLFKKWEKDNNSFAIKYYKKNNQGKHKAINYGLELACGELFFIVDSDDYLTDDALQLIDSWEKSILNKKMFCGIAGNADINYPKGERTGTYIEGTLLDRYRNIDGERPTIFYTNVFKNYKFPEFEEESFMTEAVSGNRMAHDGYKIRYYEDIISIYEYKEDGLTKKGVSLFINNPKGYGLWLREKADFLGYSYLEKLKMYYSFMIDLKNTYSPKKIAGFIGAKPITIYLCLIIYYLKRLYN